MEKEHEQNRDRSQSFDVGPELAVVGRGPRLVPSTQESLVVSGHHDVMAYYAKVVPVTTA